MLWFNIVWYNLKTKNYMVTKYYKTKYYETLFNMLTHLSKQNKLIPDFNEITLDIKYWYFKGIII